MLEYCVQGWTPYKQTTRRTVTSVPGMEVGKREMNYDNELVDLKVIGLVKRRFRGEMIDAYNFLTNKDIFQNESRKERRRKKIRYL